jgi:2'-5' RNA ligase
LRTFIAIDLSEGIRNYLGLVSQELNNYLSKGDVRWVKPEKIHLTLRFLGETENDKLSDICDIMDESTRHVEASELILGMLGCFPNAKRPRVIWVGFQSFGEDIISLQSVLEENIVNLGWKAESRSYHPHLTLGRVKNSPAVVRGQLPWGQEMSKLRVGVSAITLYESQLKSSGPEYATLHTSRLTTND